MDYFKYISIAIQIFRLIPQIQEAIRNKQSIMDLLKKFGPELIPIFQEIAGKLFPNLNLTQAVDAGALVYAAPDVVREVQAGLNKLGVTDDANQPLATDGSYGPKTKQAVTKYQKAHGLTADGWAGKVTQASISTEVAKLAPPAG